MNDLFGEIPQTLIRQGLSIVPSAQEARRKRDKGIERAAAHATEEWRERALGYVKLHALCTRQFLTEHVRNMATLDGLEAPPDGRAWGSVMQVAARQKVIVRKGFAPARSSNMSPKVLWESLIFVPR